MKRQRSPAKGPNSGSNKPHITFLRGENKITYVKPPPKSENPKLWFKEGEVVTTKPLNFVIPPNSAVNMDISTNVTLKHVSILLEGVEGIDTETKAKVSIGGANKAGKNSGGGSSSGAAVVVEERCTLEVAQRDLASELKLAQDAKASKKNSNNNNSAARKAEEEERIVSANKFYAVATCAVAVTKTSADLKEGLGEASYLPTSHASVKASLISGIYVLRNAGNRPISVMAMAVDVEARLE